MAKISQLSQLDLNGTYTYADYLTWQFDDALELIKGKIMLFIILIFKFFISFGILL